MGKDWNVRIDETIGFIRTAIVTSHQDKRELVADLLQHKYKSQITQEKSQSMSLGKSSSVFHKSREKTNRNYRRAIILIDVIILGQDSTTSVNRTKIIGNNLLPTKLGYYLKQAYEHEKQQLIRDYNDLLSNPSTFLANNKINVFALPGTSGKTGHGFYRDDYKNQYVFKPPKMKNKGYFTDNEGTLVVDIASPGVHHVHVQKYTDLSTIEVDNQIETKEIKGTKLDRSDHLMITTQLSGCSLVYQTRGEQMTAAHIQPSGRGTGNDLVGLLASHSQFDGTTRLTGSDATYAVFGRHDTMADPSDRSKRHYYKKAGNGYNKYTYIIGFRRNGRWELYAQAHDSTDPNDPPTIWQVHP